MFGGVGFRQQVRDVVGIYPTPHRGLILVHLCAPDLASGAWTVTEVRTVQQSWTIEQGAMLLAGIVHEELKRAGWTRYALCLALPPEAVDIRENVLPLALSGAELREALLWSLRASTDGSALPEDAQILCASPSEEDVCRYWIALCAEADIRALFSAFDTAGLRLRRLTVCPPVGGVLSPFLALAEEAPLSWESAEQIPDELMQPAVYAGLLFHAATPTHLYIKRDAESFAWLRHHAAAAITFCATALFLVGSAAHAGACLWARQEAERVETALSAYESDRRSMERSTVLQREIAQRIHVLTDFSQASHPWRALLVHLGCMCVDGVRITGVKAEDAAVLIEGEAVHYEAFSAMMGQFEEDAFFSGGVTLDTAVQERGEQGAPEHIRFSIRAAW